jgi:hypothetical protein
MCSFSITTTVIIPEKKNRAPISQGSHEGLHLSAQGEKEQPQCMGNTTRIGEYKHRHTHKPHQCAMERSGQHSPRVATRTHWKDAACTAGMHDLSFLYVGVLAIVIVSGVMSWTKRVDLQIIKMLLYIYTARIKKQRRSWPVLTLLW